MRQAPLNQVGRDLVGTVELFAIRDRSVDAGQLAMGYEEHCQRLSRETIPLLFFVRGGEWREDVEASYCLWARRKCSVNERRGPLGQQGHPLFRANRDQVRGKK